MSSLTKDNKLYLKLNDFKDHLFTLCFGVTDIKGYVSSNFYINLDESIFALKFTVDVNDTKKCNLEVIDETHVWSGVPVFLSIVVKR